ncbi:hypothetical protein GLYMA_03G191051v4 [Glycine max]|nr:hypothetical protein GLYMA_03G191051v4 [Glycine max]KAH1070779.1 hypothetical protein GYH30_007704 [Glycine max]
MISSFNCLGCLIFFWRVFHSPLIQTPECSVAFPVKQHSSIQGLDQLVDCHQH